MQNKLILVGAGPGDPELITIKGLKALQQADVILYDSLVNTKLFDLAFDHIKPAPELIFVGKRRLHKTMSQDQINELIVSELALGKNVVRLKGGDPFIFARGVEEIAYANQAGYEASIIPGLTSGLSIPVLNGITLTLRGASDMVSMVTGHDVNKTKLQIWSNLLNAGSTLVVYMGLFHVVEILDKLSTCDSDIHVAVIENGSLENQKNIWGNFNDIAQKLIDNGVQGPCIIVMGKHIKQDLVISSVIPVKTGIQSKL